MGTVEDVRKLFQDVVAPDLKALTSRVDGLERTLSAQFALVNATIASNHATVMHALDIDKRLDRLETREQGRGSAHV